MFKPTSEPNHVRLLAAGVAGMLTSELAAAHRCTLLGHHLRAAMQHIIHCIEDFGRGGLDRLLYCSLIQAWEYHVREKTHYRAEIPWRCDQSQITHRVLECIFRWEEAGL